MRAITSLFLSMALAVALWAPAGAAFALDAGERMPEIGLTDLSGKKVTAAGLKGKVVIVDFWASWCAPCKEEMPVLQRFHKTYGSKGLVVVGVSVDNDASNVKSFLKKLGVTFPVVHDAKHTVSERYSPPTMPSSYIVDRKGIVRHVHKGFRAGDAKKMEAEIKALLAAK